MAIRSNKISNNISRGLQDLLSSNGMQATLGVDEKGNYTLYTLSHDQPKNEYKSYRISNEDAQKLKNWGTTYWNKEAYETFTNIVKKDYDIPASMVSAKQANSPVNMGQRGYSIMDGEYGYHKPRFHSFDHPRFGTFSRGVSGILSILSGGPLYNPRRINDRVYYEPRVLERPDGYMKPGEVKSGSFGFYAKQNGQQTDALKDIGVKKAENIIYRPKGVSVPLFETETVKGKLKTKPMTQEHWKDVLSTHGIIVDRDKKTLTIKADNINKDLIYHLKDEEVKQILDGKFGLTKSTAKKGIKAASSENLTIQGRLDVLNNVIKNDFSSRITKDGLNTRNYIYLEASENLKKDLEPIQKNKLNPDTIFMDNSRENYHTGFMNHWNTIGVVDGRMIDQDKGFYLPIKDGRAVSVGEIRAYETNESKDGRYKMTAVINNQIFSHNISKEDYQKFLNYNDQYRLKIFDKIFDEVKIKSASNGIIQDKDKDIFSANIEQAREVISLDANLKIKSERGEGIITSAIAYKDQHSGSHVVEVTNDKDAIVWTARITEIEFDRFQKATDTQKAAMLSTLIPAFANSRVTVEIIDAKMLKDTSAKNLSMGFNGKKDPMTTYDSYKHSSSKESVVEQEARWQSRNKETGANPEKARTTEDKETRTFLSESNKTTIKEKNTDSQNNRQKDNTDLNLEALRTGARLALTGDALVNGRQLANEVTSKEWVRGGGHGRAVDVGDIAVQKLHDEKGQIIEGKYKMTAVIDGVSIEHTITQRDFDKFRAVNDLQRMKLFDKIFNEVDMKTKSGRGLNLGAAILAAVSVVGDVALGLSGHSRPEIYTSHTNKGVFYQPEISSPAEVAAAAYSREDSEGRSLLFKERGMGV